MVVGETHQSWWEMGPAPEGSTLSSVGYWKFSSRNTIERPYIFIFLENGNKSQLTFMNSKDSLWIWNSLTCKLPILACCLYSNPLSPLSSLLTLLSPQMWITVPYGWPLLTMYCHLKLGPKGLFIYICDNLGGSFLNLYCPDFVVNMKFHLFIYFSYWYFPFILSPLGF